MKEHKIKVGIADDHQLFRNGVISSLADYSDLEISFQAENGQDLLNKLYYHPTDVLLLDIKMPVMSGLDALIEIRKTNKIIRVIVLSMHDEDQYIKRMMSEGVNAYLFKDSEPDELYFAIKSCVETGQYLSGSVNSPLLKRLYDENKVGQGYINKTVDFDMKELTVLRLICEEKSAAEVSEITGINIRTVERIRSRMMEKVGAKNIIGLAIYATKHNLIKEH